MARRSSNIDPFNAGDPVMPWDDPSAAHEEGCELEGQPYVAPSKGRDGYVAPHSDDPFAGSKRLAASGQAPQAVADLVERLSSKDTGAGRGSAGRSKARTAKEKAAAARAAAKRVEHAATKTKRVGYWVVAAMVALFVLSEVSDCVGNALDDASDERSASYVDADGRGDADGFDEDAEQVVMWRLFEDRLAGVSEDDALRERVESQFTDECEERLGYTPEELGLDAGAFSSWVLDGFDYSMDSVYCYEGDEGEDPYGFAYFYLTGYDSYAVRSDLLDRVKDYLEGQGVNVGGYGVAGEGVLDDGQRSAVRGIYEDVVGAARPENQSFRAVEVTYVDGSWEVDEDAYDSFVYGFFDIWES